jgi:hypothetical protein
MHTTSTKHIYRITPPPEKTSISTLAAGWGTSTYLRSKHELFIPPSFFFPAFPFSFYQREGFVRRRDRWTDGETGGKLRLMTTHPARSHFFWRCFLGGFGWMVDAVGIISARHATFTGTLFLFGAACLSIGCVFAFFAFVFAVPPLRVTLVELHY